MESVPDDVRFAQLAFPNDKCRPTHCRKRCYGTPIPFDVAANLCNPVVTILLRHPRAASTIVAMPEATIDEYRLARPDISDVGPTRDIPAV